MAKEGKRKKVPVWVWPVVGWLLFVCYWALYPAPALPPLDMRPHHMTWDLNRELHRFEPDPAWPDLYLRHYLQPRLVIVPSPDGDTPHWPYPPSDKDTQFLRGGGTGGLLDWSTAMLIFGVFMVPIGALGVRLARRRKAHPALEAAIGVLMAGGVARLAAMLYMAFLQWMM